MNRSLCLFAPAIVLAIAGCTSLHGKAIADQEIKATAIMSSPGGEGLGESPGAVWINDKKGLISFMARLNRVRIGGQSDAIPDLDYNSDGLLAIWMGKRPTGGYRIELASDSLSVTEHTAVVIVRWVEPAKGAVLPQRITGPYLLIRIERGDYRRIKVVDEKGVIRAETDVKTETESLRQP